MDRDADQLKRDVEFIIRLGERFEKQIKLTEAAANTRKTKVSAKKGSDSRPGANATLQLPRFNLQFR